MNIIRSFSAASILIFLSSAALAIDPEEHTAHHPDAPISASGTQTDNKITVKNESKMHGSMHQESMEKMDSQMKVMSEMHGKMMNAKTAGERKALMAEHMKVMQAGMAMMNNMSKPGGMPMMGNSPKKTSIESDAKSKMHDGMKSDMNPDMAMHHEMMEKRMQMMENMMQMTMDRLAL